MSYTPPKDPLALTLQPSAIWLGDEIKLVSIKNGRIQVNFKDGSALLAHAICGFAAPKEQPINKLVEIRNLTGQGEVCEIVPQRQG